MKNQDIVSKSVGELYDHLYGLKKDLLNIRLQRSTGSLTNTAEIRLKRRSVARIKSRLTQLVKKK